MTDRSEQAIPSINVKTFNQRYDSRLSAFPSRSNEIVFFCVTNIEYTVVKHAYHDVCNGSTVGELGYWVDSSITRIVQSGVEHSWIPSVGTYFETGEY